MAFNRNFLGRVSSSANQQAGSVWTYTSADDNIATIATAGYFNDIQVRVADELGPLKVGDVFIVSGSDANAMYVVTENGDPNVELASFAALGQISTAQIENDAVTADKLAANAVTTAKILNNNVTSAKLAPEVLKHARVSMTAAQWNGMFAAPFELVPAQGADTLIVLRNFRINLDYGGTAFEDGGAISIQYDDTAEAGGVLATATYAAGTFIGHTADTSFSMAPVLTALAHSGVLNEGLYLSNATQAFAAGAGSELEIDIWYSVVSMFA